MKIDMETDPKLRQRRTSAESADGNRIIKQLDVR